MPPKVNEEGRLEKFFGKAWEGSYFVAVSSIYGLVGRDLMKLYC